MGSHFMVAAAFDAHLRPVDHSASATSAVRPRALLYPSGFAVDPESARAASCKKWDYKSY